MRETEAGSGSEKAMEAEVGMTGWRRGQEPSKAVASRGCKGPRNEFSQQPLERAQPAKTLTLGFLTFRTGR
jgi:hypothetical protein